MKTMYHSIPTQAFHISFNLKSGIMELGLTRTVPPSRLLSL